MNKITIVNEGSEYQELNIGDNNHSFDIGSKDNDNEVCLQICSSDTYTFYLNQEEIKAVIKHLQAQVIQE